MHDAAGESLFVRNATGMTPTPKAEALWLQVRAALAALQLALAPGEFDPQAQDVSFRLAMADAVAALLAAGRNATLRHAPLVETRCVCVMRRGHALAEQALTLKAYCAADHLLTSSVGRPQSHVDQMRSALGRQRRVVLSVNQFFTAARVLLQSDLVTVLPLAFVPATGHAEQLRVRELPFDLGAMQVSMVWHLRRDAEPAHRWLRERVLQAAGAAFRSGVAPP